MEHDLFIKEQMRNDLLMKELAPQHRHKTVRRFLELDDTVRDRGEGCICVVIGTGNERLQTKRRYLFTAQDFFLQGAQRLF